MKDFIKQLESALSPIKEAWHDEYFDILEKPWSDAVDYDKTIEKQPEKVNRYIPGSPEKDFAQCSDKDKAGEFRFRLKATNGQVIAASEGYTKKDSCENGIASVQKNAVDAETVLPE